MSLRDSQALLTVILLLITASIHFSAQIGMWLVGFAPWRKKPHSQNGMWLVGVDPWIKKPPAQIGLWLVSVAPCELACGLSILLHGQRFNMTNWHMAYWLCSINKEGSYPNWHVACWFCSMEDEAACPNKHVACRFCPKDKEATCPNLPVDCWWFSME